MTNFVAVFSCLIFIIFLGCRPDTSINSSEGPEAFGISSMGATGNAVTIQWGNSSGAASYDIFRTPPGGGSSFSLLASHVTSPYYDTTVAEGQRYRYRVLAHSEKGASTSSDGNGSVVSSDGGSPSSPESSSSITVIMKPSGVSSGSAGENSIALTWGPGTSLTKGYLVVASPSSIATFTPVAGVKYTVGQDLGSSQTVVFNSTALSAVHSSLTVGVRYYYSVFAYDSALNYSAPRTSSAVPQLGKPSGFVAAATGITSIGLVWVIGSSNVAGYLLVAKPSSAVTFAPVEGTSYTNGQDLGNSQTVIYNSNGTSVTQTSLAVGVTYYYALFAYSSLLHYSLPATSSDLTRFIWGQQAYVKAGHPKASDNFGTSVAIDGDTMVVGSPYEDSSQNSITNGTGSASDVLSLDSGAVYIYRRSGLNWVQEAYLKASNVGPQDRFGTVVAIEGDTVVVGSPFEDSNRTTISNVVPIASDNEIATNSGAAYVFKRTGSSWVQEAYLKAPNAEVEDRFGSSVAIYGNTIVVGAPLEDSSDISIINGATASANNGALSAGAAYVFTRSSTTWAQQAFLKAPNCRAGHQFGTSVALYADTIVVGAPLEESSETLVINGTVSFDHSVSAAGAAYVFVRPSAGVTWSQEAYLKAPNTALGNQFGAAIAIHLDTVVVGAPQESSNQKTINNNETASFDTSAPSAGSAYVFKRTIVLSVVNWAQQAYLKAVNARSNDQFGSSVAVNGDTVAVGDRFESGNQRFITNGATACTNNFASGSGAVFVYKRNVTSWGQEAYIKTVNGISGDQLGAGVGISSDTVVVGAAAEDSNQNTITNGSTASFNTSATDAGATYVYQRN